MSTDGIKTLSVPQAGKIYFGIGKNASYEAAKKGEIIVLRIGGLLRVPVVAMERRLAEAGSKPSEPAPLPVDLSDGPAALVTRLAGSNSSKTRSSRLASGGRAAPPASSNGGTDPG